MNHTELDGMSRAFKYNVQTFTSFLLVHFLAGFLAMLFYLSIVYGCGKDPFALQSLYCIVEPYVKPPSCTYTTELISRDEYCVYVPRGSKCLRYSCRLTRFDYRILITRNEFLHTGSENLKGCIFRLSVRSRLRAADTGSMIRRLEGRTTFFRVTRHTCTSR